MELATGVLSWDASERRSLRYGHVVIAGNTYNGETRPVTVDHANFDRLVRKRVKLMATVVEVRESGHIGDRRIGVKPTIPTIGEVITIGVGWLHKTDVMWGTGFELWPAEYLKDCPTTLWLDPRVLYRLHDQTVRLSAEVTTEDYIPVQSFENAPDFVVIPEAEGTAFQVSSEYSGVEPELTVERVPDMESAFFITRTGWNPVK